MGTPYLCYGGAQIWQLEIMQTSGFSIVINLIIVHCEQANYSPKHISTTFTIQRAQYHSINYFLAYVAAFSVTILMSRRVNLEN